MNSQDQLKYYTKRCVSLMSQLELSSQKLMSDERNTSDLEKAIWNSIDEKDLIRLKALHSKLCKLVDQSEGV